MHRHVARSRPQDGHQQTAPGNRPRDRRQRRQQHAVNEADDHRQDDVDDEGHEEPVGMEARQVRPLLARAGQGHAGQKVDRCPEALTAEQPPEEGGDRHHQAADDAAPDPGRDGMDRFRQARPVSGHAGPQLLDLAPFRRDGHRPSCRLNPGLVKMTPTRQQRQNPDAQAGDQHQGPHHHEGQAQHRSGRQESHAQRQHQGSDRRPRHLDGVRPGRCI